jgi:hypothetical protein
MTTVPPKLLNDNYHADINDVPSIYDEVSMRIEKFKYPYSFKLKTSKTQLPYSEKIVNDEKIEQFYGLKHIRKQDMRGALNIPVPYWHIYHQIYPYTYVGHVEPTLYQSGKIKTNPIYIEKIILHEHITGESQRGWELFKKYPIVPLANKIKCFIGYEKVSLSYIEEIISFREKYGKHTISDDYTLLNLTYRNASPNPKEITKLSKLLDTYKLKHFASNKNICDPSTVKDLLKKVGGNFDVVILSIIYFVYSAGFYNEHLNSQLLFNKMLFGLSLQKIGGNMVISLYDSLTYISAQIIYLLSKYYEKVYIAKPSLSNAIRPYKNLVCIGYKGCDDIHEIERIGMEWNKIDNRCSIDLTVNDPKLKKKYDVHEESEEYKRPFVTDILHFDKQPNDFYKMIKYYNNTEVTRGINIFQLIMHNYIKLSKATELEIAKMDESFHAKHIYNAIKWCQEYDIEIRHKYDKSFYSNKIIGDLFGYEEPIVTKFKKHTSGPVDINLKFFESNYDVNIDKLQKMRAYLIRTKRIIDTRDINRWSKITANIKLHKNVKKIVSKRYALIPISQAFLKMYEMITLLNIVPKFGERFKTFSLCEAPGQFMIAINHYVKTHTHIKKYEWLAQSLNPWNEKVKKQYGNVLSDYYGLVRGFRKNWLFGSDDTGDITHKENIKSYKPLLKDIDYMTSDCGLPTPFKELAYQEEYMSFINYSQMLFILYNLPKGKHCTFKTFLPISLPIMISMMYIFYRSFDELYIYKPLQNPSSSEVYVTGKGFLGVSETTSDALFYVLEHFNKNKYLLKIPEEFIYQYTKNVSKFINRTANSVHRSVYYYDNYDEMMKYDKSLETIMQQRVNEWISFFKILPIKPHEKINIRMKR